MTPAAQPPQGLLAQIGQRPRLLWWLGALLLATAAAAVLWAFHSGRARASAQLQAVADLRQAQIEAWLGERLNLGRTIAQSHALARLLEPGDGRTPDAGRRELLAQLGDLHRIVRAEGVLVLDAQGQLLGSDLPAPPAAPTPLLLASVQQAVREGEVGHTGLYRTGADAASQRLDITIPLRRSAGPTLALVVLRLKPQDSLYQMLSAWPVPSETGETLLWRREGARLVLQSPARGAAADPPPTRPIDPTVKALQWMFTGGPPPREATIVRDWRGERVLGVARWVAGQHWLLGTKLDLQEVDAAAWVSARWTAALCAALLGGLAITGRLARQRQALVLAASSAAREQQRLQALLPLQAIADQASESIFAKGLDGRYLFANRAAFASMRLLPEQVVGRTDAELFPPALAATVRAQDERVMALGRTDTFETDMPSPTGPRRKITTKGLLRDDGGAVIGLFGVSLDITERVQAEAALAAHQQSLQALVDSRTQALQQANAQLQAAERLARTVAENLPGRVAYFDAQLVCRFANRHYCDWMNRPPAQVVGQHLRALLGDEGFELRRALNEAALAGQPQLVERRFPQPDGRDVVHQIHYLPDRAEDGTVHGLYFTAWDVSALKAAEDQLQAANTTLALARDVAEQASRAKSAFLANMSHEIRTPMNAIIGLAHLALREAERPAQRERLDKIGQSAQHLLQVINDILDLSKIEAERLALEQIPFSLDTVLQRCFEMVAEPARAKGLELIVDTDHLPDQLVGDPTRLTQALLNLLVNAVKFTERGWVRLQGERLGNDGERVQVRFSVQDTGPGIAPEQLSRLFTAYEQLDLATSRQHGGTGLGLSLTRRLAELMDGEAGVDSTPGQGSRFWFTAWLGRGADHSARPAPLLAGARVLLVDDLPEARQALGERLQQFGLQLTAADGAASALAHVRQALAAGQASALWLIDWQMPGQDGLQTLEALRQLHQQWPSPVPPAVMVTASDDAALRARALAAGFAAVLVKPVTASQLHDTLVRVLGRGRPAATAAPPVPADTPAAPPGGAEAALRRRHAGARILLVEDNPINQEVAMDLLAVAGLVPELAEDGAQAVAMALARPYALVLMDMQLPGLDGPEATRRLRAAGYRQPVIAMTANAFADDLRTCREAGMDDHVAKPVDPERLYTALLRWLPMGSAPPASPAGPTRQDA